MSTTNTETLKLYKNTKLYNGSRYKIYQGNQGNPRDIESVLGTPDYNKQVNYKSITEPITIGEYIDDCDQYTYGSITNHGKTYYIFVDSIMTDAYGLTTIEFTVDWWSTNWLDINCTIGHLTRKPEKPQYMEQPYTPLSTTVEQSTISTDYCFGATYIPNTEKGTSYISALYLPGNTQMFNLINCGNWYNELKLPGADIKDCFAIPIFSYDDIKNSIEYNIMYRVEGEDSTQIETYFRDNFTELVPLQPNDRYYLYNATDGDTFTAQYDTTYPDNCRVFRGIYPNTQHPWLDCGYREIYVQKKGGIYDFHYLQEVFNTHEYTYPDITKTINFNFISDDKNKQGIIDWNGNIIWECPYNVSIDSFKITLLKGLSHIMLQFIPIISSNALISELLTGKGFTYDCRHPGLFVDSYQDYVLKNREYDIQMRRIQSERQELQAWASTAENVGFGFAFGQGQGAAASGIGGVIEATSTWLLNQHFDPQIQAQYDKRYQRMTDQISIIGDSITNLKIENSMMKYVLKMDTPTQTRMKNDIENNGYLCDEVVSNLQALFKYTTTLNTQDNFTVKPVFQADNVVVEGACNVVGKQQVVRRLQNGVEFI